MSLRIEKHGANWRFVGVPSAPVVLKERKLSFDHRFLAFGCDGCRQSDHAICSGCGEDICLGLLSEVQRAKTKRDLLRWHGCRGLDQRVAA